MRKSYIDNIRWAVQVIVVIFHVFFMYNSVGVQGGLGNVSEKVPLYCDMILYIVYPWLMPVLFIVSGICSRYYLERHTAKEFIRSRTTKLLIPVTVGLAFFWFIQGYVSMSLSGAFDTMPGLPFPILFIIMMLSGIGPMWYMQMLWLFCLLIVLMRKAEKDRLWQLGGKTNTAVLILMAVLVWGAGQILNTPVIVVYRFGLYTLMFLLGYFVFSHDEVTEILKKRFWFFLAIALATGTAFCIMYFGQNYADAPVNKTPLFLVYSWFGCLSIIGGAAKFADFENSFTRWMSSHSFGLYMFHYLCISAAALFLVKSGVLGTDMNAPHVYMISMIAGFGGAFLLNAVVSRIPFIRWAVLGIRKEKKNVQG